MIRPAKNPRRKPDAGHKGRARAAARRRARAGLGPIQALILTLGKTLVGFLPCARRIRAANDPRA